jgi:hypothetical protein
LRGKVTNLASKTQIESPLGLSQVDNN